MKLALNAAIPILICTALLLGCNTSNRTPTTEEVISGVPETWESITNRWGSQPIKSVERSALRGDATSQLYLGSLYWSGQGVPTNSDESIKWIHKAADGGLAAAQNRLGWNYLHGMGVTTNYNEAIRWFREAAQQGYANAHYNLGTMYYSGRGEPQDYELALEHFKPAAERGNPWAQSSLGYLYREGLGTTQNELLSVSWYRKAVDQGVAEAQLNLGNAYFHGKGVTQDYQEAARLYRLAADQGDATAQNNIEWIFHEGLGCPEDPLDAEKWFLKSANNGERRAAANLAWMYARGVYGSGKFTGQGAEAQIQSGGLAPNHKFAKQWMLKAVDLDTAEGQYLMGSLLANMVNDRGVYDYSAAPEAAEYFLETAEQGHANAQYELGRLHYLEKLGASRTDSIPWYLKAAAQGHLRAQQYVARLKIQYPDNELLKSVGLIETLQSNAERDDLYSQHELAKRYQSGDGVNKDLAKAFAWMEKAARQDQTKNTLVSTAIYQLGLMYEKGEGTAPDSEMAESLFYQAAAGHEPNACYRVGLMDEKEGEYHAATRNYLKAMISMGGGDHDDEALERLLRLYSDGRGLHSRVPEFDEYLEEYLVDRRNFLRFVERSILTPTAHYLVGEIYLEGDAVPRDVVEAAAWLEIAADQDFDGAQSLLEQARSEMSAAQLQEASQRHQELRQESRILR